MGKFIDENGIAKVRLITPGQGTSAYYKEGQLERDGNAFTGGQVYIDHPTKSERRDRPERSLRDFVGPVVGTPLYERNYKQGPGLYGKVKVAKHWRPFIEELGDDIGVSIRANGTRTMETIDGKRVFVAEKFYPGAGFDFVTKAGRGGKLVPLFEAATARADAKIEQWMRESEFIESDTRSEEERFTEWLDRDPTPTKEEDMELQEAMTKLKESEDKVTTLTDEKDELAEENKRLQEALALRDGRDKIIEALADKAVKLPDATKERIVENLTKTTPMKEGKLDEEALKAQIAEAVKTEREYVEKIAPKSGIRGMGETTDDGGKERLLKQFEESFRIKNPGKSEEEIKRMAEIATRGR